MNTKLENVKIFSIPSLPGDLLLEIATFVELRSDLFHFSISVGSLVDIFIYLLHIATPVIQTLLEPHTRVIRIRHPGHFRAMC
jgi:hypothetical protein